MSVERRWGATSVVQIRILAAGLVLLAAGCSLFWFGSGHTLVAAKPTASGILGQARTGSSTLPKSVAAKEISGADLSSKAPSLLAGLPLYFEPNQGQGNLDSSDTRAEFISRGAGYSLFLGSSGAILSLASHEPKKKGSSVPGNPSAPTLEFLQMKLAGSNPQARLSATNLLPGKSNYFIGNDPSKWRTKVPHFARVHYEDIYPGINLVFYGSEGHLEYDFQVGPGSDPGQAELEFDGARKLELKDGALLIQAAHGSMALQAPRVYQEISGKQQPVEASFVLRGNNRAGFAVAPYDHSRELIIDPVLNFSTYFGGTGDERNNFVAVDGNLNIYLAGSTTSPSLPGISSGSLQQTLKGAQNVYVAKITPPLGSIAATLDDVTYLGGSGTDSPVGIQVDGGGSPYLAGTTSSTDFPITATNAYQATIYSGSTGTVHVFVTRIESDFTALHYSSYLSGNGTDTASGMTIDSAANLYVTGTTTSNNVANAGAGVHFPASISPNLPAFQPISNAAIQFFVTKVATNNSRFSSIPYSTYFGGENFTPPTGSTLPIAIGGGIAVDTNQNVYFTGTTNFTYTGSAVGDFPILNAYQPCLNSPPSAVVVPPQSCGTAPDPTIPDAFAAKLNTTSVSPTQQLVWSTYIGGTGTDSGAGIALDTGAANVYVVGTTNSPDFVNSAFVSTFASFQKCLNNLFLTGTPPCQSQTNPPNDAFVVRLTNPTIPQGSTTTIALNYFSYLGGSGEEAGNAITVDSNSGAVITGLTQSTFTSTTTAGTFPLTPSPSSIQSQLNDAQAAFIARINTAAVTGQTTTASWATYFGGACVTNPAPPPPCLPYVTSGTGIALDVNQDTYVSGETNSTNLLVAKPLAQNTTLAGGYDAFVAQLGAAYSISISGVLGLGTNQSFIAAGNPATFTYTITNSGPDLASNITILANMSQASTFVPLTNITGSISTGTCGAGSTGTGISCGPISLQAGSTATLTITATPTANSSGAAPQAFNGGTIQVLAPGNIVKAQTSVAAQMSDFKMTVSPLNQSVPQAGAPASFTVSLTPQPLFGSPITLSCTGTPAGSSCAFNPGTSVTLQSSSGSTVTLTIPTTARPITPAASLFKRQFYALWLAIPGIAILGMGGGRRRKIAGISMLCMIFALLLLVPACSHSTTQTPVSGTPAGTYTITVTASSGTNSKSQNITLTVP